ncbi:hypothetical protein Tco_1041548 [Tanacetum coccineum]|uniref:Reverse transcriptase domain-containing protein n=1 Tax=Tanacetum coccineum TaxID=301880 RepID=A0ABQ5GHH7_9ASTR
MTPPPGFSTPPQILNITTSERPPATTTVFAATTPENTPFAYHASTSTNPNPTISPAFDYDEEREIEPRLEPLREATSTLWLRSPRIRKQQERVVGFENAPNEEGNRRRRNAKGIRNEHSQPLRSSLTSVKGGHQPSTNMGETSLLMPSAGLVHGQAPNFPFQTQIGNPPAGSTFAYHPQGGYIPQAFTNNSVPSYNGPMHPTVTPSSSYPFYTQPMYAPPNIPAYPNLAGPFTDSAGSVTPFVRWIEDYPLPDGLKMPSHIGSYDGKWYPDNFLHLFEGAIRMQKWLMPVACHMFTYTLKDSARICQQKKFTKTHLAVHDIKQREDESTRAFIARYTDDTLQILGLHEEQRISCFVHGLRTRSLVEHLSTDLPSTYKGLMEKTYTWVEAKEVATNSVSNDQRDGFERSKKSSWDNNRGQKNKDRFSPYRGPNHGLLPSLSKSPKEILATKKTTRSFEPPPKLFGSKRLRDTSKYCHFHEDYGHDTNDCTHLRTQIPSCKVKGIIVMKIAQRSDDEVVKNNAKALRA